MKFISRVDGELKPESGVLGDRELRILPAYAIASARQEEPMLPAAATIRRLHESGLKFDVVCTVYFEE